MPSIRFTVQKLKTIKVANFDFLFVHDEERAHGVDLLQVQPN
jgi:hypothetical protein